MRLQKKHMIYAGLVGAALCAWGADSIFVTPPSTAPEQRAAAFTTPHEASGEAPTAGTASSASTSGKWLAVKLGQWGQDHPCAQQDSRDIFSIPADWQPPKIAPTTQPLATRVPSFTHEHHLNAVILSPNGDSALIDGRLVRVGEFVEEFRLINVTKGRAEFTASDGTQIPLVISP